jgi:predicted RNA-binding Zn-ribbon protein involved in translation (DUF1610 family)
VKEPIAPYACKHERMLFVESCRSTPPPYRHTVFLCPACGTFRVAGRVTGEREEVSFKVEFTLPTEELAEAAGQYSRLLRQEEERDGA